MKPMRPTAVVGRSLARTDRPAVAHPPEGAPGRVDHVLPVDAGPPVRVLRGTALPTDVAVTVTGSAPGAESESPSGDRGH